MGTELLARGVPDAGRPWTALANRTHGDLVQTVHRDYARAGATHHTANTFRTRPADVGRDWLDLAALAVHHGRAAIGPGHRLWASVAPQADCYRPGDWPGQDDHEVVVQGFATLDIDGLLLETFANRNEVLGACTAAVGTGLPVWVALTAGPQADLLTPQALSILAAELRACGAARVLVNCTEPSATAAYVRAIADRDVPVGAYANAGALTGGLGWGVPTDGSAYADLAEDWIRAGAEVVGGCCGTAPVHIRALAQRFAQDPP